MQQQMHELKKDVSDLVEELTDMLGEAQVSLDQFKETIDSRMAQLEALLQQPQMICWEETADVLAQTPPEAFTATTTVEAELDKQMVSDAQFRQQYYEARARERQARLKAGV